jgi:hypothetical protein
MEQIEKHIIKIKFTDEEKKAIKNCIETIDCEGVSCEPCPFEYNCGCILERLREVIKD